MAQQVGSRVSVRARHALLIVLAVSGHLVSVAAFVWLPWAEGRAVFVGRDFTGPELARLARNLDLLLPEAAGPAALLSALALYAVPVAALAGALLVILSLWTDRPAAGLRAAALAGIVVAATSTIVALLLAVGPAAGDSLGRIPGAGAAFAVVGGLLAGLTASGAVGYSERR
jgi:hypothetical protein